MKNLILAAVAVFTIGAATAQDMKFGIKGGLNVATVTSSDAKTLIGGNFGVFGDFKVSDKFSVQPEILYSLQGSKAENAGNAELNLDFINIPIMAKIKVADAFSLQAGPQIGFLMSAKAAGQDIKNSLSSVDFGLNFGAGYDFSENFMMDVRYNLGLTELVKDLPSGVTGFKNRVLSVNLGYSF